MPKDVNEVSVYKGQKQFSVEDCSEDPGTRLREADGSQMREANLDHGEKSG